VQEIQTLQDLDAALSDSRGRPVLLFKHSTTCPISAFAHGQVLDFARQAGDAAPPIYFVRVRESRPVSNEIASRLGIVHQSPQLILIQNQQPVWHVSHSSIEAQQIASALKKAAA